MFSPRQFTLGKFALIILFVTIATSVLALSIAKAGWEIAYETKMGDGLREIAITTETKKDGITHKSCYWFPETRVLPGFFLYEIKLIRDNLWWYYAPNDLAKVKTANLIADKRMMEAVRLEEENPQNVMIWETSLKAVEWINRAQAYLGKVEKGEGEKEFLKFKLTEARLTYKSILNSFSKSCDNGVQYQQLSEKLSKPDENKITL
ncbi:MAG: hypothetical protein WCT01_02805 [Candidatus Shapirobacteria bacterium]